MILDLFSCETCIASKMQRKSDVLIDNREVVKFWDGKNWIPFCLELQRRGVCGKMLLAQAVKDGAITIHLIDVLDRGLLVGGADEQAL